MHLDSHAAVHDNPNCFPLPTYSPCTHFCFPLPSVGSESMVPTLDGEESLKGF